MHGEVCLDVRVCARARMVRFGGALDGVLLCRCQMETPEATWLVMLFVDVT